jgi:hypothetical protein
MGEHGRGAVENRVLARIIGPNEDEITGRWKTLHSEDLHNLNLWTNIVRMIKSRIMRWAGQVAQMGENYI